MPDASVNDGSNLRRRIAERAYFAWLAGVGGSDADRWLAAEAREAPSGIAAPKRKRLFSLSQRLAASAPEN